jgi:hypothetical protein
MVLSHMVLIWNRLRYYFPLFYLSFPSLIPLREFSFSYYYSYHYHELVYLDVS